MLRLQIGGGGEGWQTADDWLETMA